MNKFLKAFLVFIGINAVGTVLAMIEPFLGGLLSTLLFLVSIIVAIVILASGSSGSSAPTLQPKATEHGVPTFSWKGVEIYRDQGFFTFQTRRYLISEVRQVSFETSRHRGCMGGAHYLIHIHLNNLNTPRLTLSAGNITSGGNQEVERNYDRLQIAFGFHG